MLQVILSQKLRVLFVLYSIQIEGMVRVKANIPLKITINSINFM